MNPARIAELLEPFLGPSDDRSEPAPPLAAAPAAVERRPGGLTTNDLTNISTYIDLLLRWNARINLTAIRNPEDIVTRHFGESLFAARHLFPDRTSIRAHERRAKDQGPTTTGRASLADVGSGAGFPGIPIKLWAPQISLTLIEPSHKKSAFLREVVRALTLTDINIQTARAQDLTQPNPNPMNQDAPNQHMSKQNSASVQQDLRPHFEVVTLRAVERFPSILPVAAALVAPGGRLVLLIGSSQQDHVLTTLPAFRWLAPARIPSSTSRSLLIGQYEPQ